MEPAHSPRTAIRLAAATTATLLSIGAGLVAGATDPAHAAAPVPTCFDHKPTIVGTNGADTITGTSHADVIVALGGDDKIHGNGGDDLICAGDGADAISGDAGNDKIKGGTGRYVGGRDPSVAPDVINGGAGNDYIDPVYDDRGLYGGSADVVTYAAATGPVVVRADQGYVDARRGGLGRDTVVSTHAAFVGSAYDDTMVGGAEADSFDGRAGADVLRGGAGNDVLFDGGTSASRTSGDNDTLDGGPGDDELRARGGEDTLVGGDGDDVIVDVGDSADQIDAGDGDDQVQDEVDGLPQTVDGGAGRDDVQLDGTYLGTTPVDVDLAAGTLRVGPGQDTSTSEMTGVERVRAWVRGPLRIAGTDGDDVMGGDGPHQGPVTLIGRGGDDLLYGGDSDDSIDGGPGRDGAGPGRGTDTCTSVEHTDPSDRCEVNR